MTSNRREPPPDHQIYDTYSQDYSPPSNTQSSSDQSQLPPSDPFNSLTATQVEQMDSVEQDQGIEPRTLESQKVREKLNVSANFCCDIGKYPQASKLVNLLLKDEPSRQDLLQLRTKIQVESNQLVTASIDPQLIEQENANSGEKSQGSELQNSLLPQQEPASSKQQSSGYKRKFFDETSSSKSARTVKVSVDEVSKDPDELSVVNFMV